MRGITLAPRAPAVLAAEAVGALCRPVRGRTGATLCSQQEWVCELRNPALSGRTPVRVSDQPTAPIDPSEIAPGLVVRLDPRVLNAHPDVCYTQDPPVTRPGLFVCVAVEPTMSDDITTWAGLTTQPRWERLSIDPDWRTGGFDRWRLTPQYLTDGASLWSGPREAFVAASLQEVSKPSRNRARISRAGLDAIRAEIAAQEGRRHRSSHALDALRPSSRKKKRRNRRRSR